MKINHHLDDATLMSLSAGTLGEALSVVAAAHVSNCSICSARLRQMDALGGLLLEKADTAPLEAGRSSVAQLALAKLSAQPRESEFAERRPKARGASDLPGPLAWLIDKPIEDISWRWMGPGVATHVLKLSDRSSGDLRLLRVAPGKKLPEHGHNGTELTLILSGAYRDEYGHFGPGDIADMDEEVEHQPVVEPGEDCICIVASEAPARFKGTLSRLLQPLIGM